MRSFSSLTDSLDSAFAQLPGVDGQLRMAPRPRVGWRPGRIPEGARASAVLLLLYPVEEAPHLLLTVRNPGLAHHPGQVSFPGGAVEEGESIEGAALREAEEETGVDPERVRIAGALTPLHVPVSGNVLYPRVGWTAHRPAWSPDPREVQRILEVPLRQLSDPATIEIDMRERLERQVEVPYFAVQGERVWGATAMVLAEFLTALGRPPRPWD